MDKKKKDDEIIELTDKELDEIFADDDFDNGEDGGEIRSFYFSNPDPYAKVDPRPDDAPKREFSFDDKGNIVVKNPSAYWLPDMRKENAPEAALYEQVPFVLLSRFCIDAQLVLRVDRGEDDLFELCALLGQLILQPSLVVAGVPQVFGHDPPVDHYVGAEPGGLDNELEIIRRGGAAAAAGQNADRPVDLKNGALHLRQVEISLRAQVSEEFVDIEMGGGEIFLIEPAVFIEDGRLSHKKAPCGDRLVGQQRDEQADGGIDGHSRCGAQQPARLGQRHFGGDRADGDAVDIVEKVELRYLPLAQQPRQHEHDEQRGQRAQHRFQNVHTPSRPVLCISERAPAAPERGTGPCCRPLQAVRMTARAFAAPI